MLVVSQYLYLPGCCTFCRGTNTPVIDTQMDLDTLNSPDDPNPSANHRMYICADCAINLAGLVADHRGLSFTKTSYKGEVEGIIENLTSSNVELSKRVDDLENALRVVKTIAPAAAESTPTKKTFKVVDPEAAPK